MAVATSTILDNAFDVDAFVLADLPFNAYYPGEEAVTAVWVPAGGFPWWRPFYIFNPERQVDWNNVADALKKIYQDKPKTKKRKKRRTVKKEVDSAPVNLPTLRLETFVLPSVQGFYVAPVVRLSHRGRQMAVYTMTRLEVQRRARIKRQNDILLLDLL